MNNLYEVFDRNSDYTFEDFIRNVFVYMSLGLSLTAMASFLCYYSISNGGIVLRILYRFPYIVLILAVSELLISFILTRSIQKMSLFSMKMLFFMYLLLTGISFTSVFIVYDLGEVFKAFIFAAGFFISMLIIGKTTRLDLTRFRTIFIAGLLTLFVLSIISIVLGSDSLDIFISWIGLIIFIGLTAYDVQKLRDIYYGYVGDIKMEQKLSIYGSFSLYLDFINMFIYILRIYGNRRRRD